MVAIIDYGVGNLFSLKSSFAAIGEESKVSGDPEVLQRADRLVLPGVGAFEDAAKKLFDSGLAGVVKEEAAGGKPLLGICLGMQLLFEKSYEKGEFEGLGLIKGSVKPLQGYIPAELKIPHIGWNALTFTKNSPLFKSLTEGDHMYFVHSYYAADCGPAVSALTDYGAPVTAAAEEGNVYGCQFHPEKSGRKGLSILKAFCEI